MIFWEKISIKRRRFSCRKTNIFIKLKFYKAKKEMKFSHFLMVFVIFSISFYSTSKLLSTCLINDHLKFICFIFYQQARTWEIRVSRIRYHIQRYYQTNVILAPEIIAIVVGSLHQERVITMTNRIVGEFVAAKTDVIHKKKTKLT